jgi:hypothetical protein
MSNNYSSFCECFKDVTPDELGWITNTLELDTIDDEEIVELLGRQGITEKISDPDTWPAFNWDYTGDEVFIYAEEEFNLDHVRIFMQAFLKRFRPGSSFIMTWADYCSRNLSGAFGGGAALITAEECIVKTTQAFRNEWESNNEEENE